MFFGTFLRIYLILNCMQCDDMRQREREGELYLQMDDLDKRCTMGKVSLRNGMFLK